MGTNINKKLISPEITFKFKGTNLEVLSSLHPLLSTTCLFNAGVHMCRVQHVKSHLMWEFACLKPINSHFFPFFVSSCCREIFCPCIAPVGLQYREELEREKLRKSFIGSSNNTRRSHLHVIKNNPGIISPVTFFQFVDTVK